MKKCIALQNENPFFEELNYGFLKMNYWAGILFGIIIAVVGFLSFFIVPAGFFYSLTSLTLIASFLYFIIGLLFLMHKKIEIIVFSIFLLMGIAKGLWRGVIIVLSAIIALCILLASIIVFYYIVEYVIINLFFILLI